jgi:hypothetical protein
MVLCLTVDSNTKRKIGNQWGDTLVFNYFRLTYSFMYNNCSTAFLQQIQCTLCPEVYEDIFKTGV